MLPFAHACIVICSSNLWYDFIYFYTFELVGPKENGIRICEFSLFFPRLSITYFISCFFVPSNFVFLFVIPYSISIPKVVSLFSSILNLSTYSFLLFFFFCYLASFFFFVSFFDFFPSVNFSNAFLILPFLLLLPSDVFCLEIWCINGICSPK